MDSESLMLAIQLQRQDLTLCEQSRKGKQRAGEVTDSDLALEARTRVNGDADSNAKPTPAEAIDDVDDALIETFKSMNLIVPIVTDDGLDEEHLEHAESSRWASSRKQPDTRECMACTDRLPSAALFRPPCSHEYCDECLLNLVRSSLLDESLFPPRCCGQHIPINPQRWFSPGLVGEFRAKKIEFDTPNPCLCKAEFCYICGKRWKTCICAQWEEDRLVRRANAIVDRAGQIDERARQIRVEQERHNLMENHECTHQNWRWRPGPHRCEECRDVLRQFIYECRQCHIMACLWIDEDRLQY
ncbi:hypothetical protein FDECE_13808 [Fusarium decemcellulare]|nr:hypothetical protein FDECE_13808 [Fusarium decemcellulare]